MTTAANNCPHCGFPLPVPIPGESQYCPRCGPPAIRPHWKAWIFFLILLLLPPGLIFVLGVSSIITPPYRAGGGALLSLFCPLIAIPVCSLFCGWFLASLGTRRPLLRVLLTLGLAIPIAGFQISLVWMGCVRLIH